MNRILGILTTLCLILSAQEQIYANFDVVAKHSAELAIKSFGIVKKVNVDVSDMVKKGDVLVELENESEKIALEAAKNDLELANLALKHAKDILERFKKVKSVTSTQAYEDAEFEFKRASLAVQKAKIAIKNANEMLENKLLKAPFDGIISKKSIELGEGVGGVAQRLIGIFSYPEVKLVISYDEKFKDAVKVGSEFRYKLDGSNEEMVGAIALIHPKIDTRTRKIYAEVYAQGLMPGLFGEGYITVK